MKKILIAATVLASLGLTAAAQARDDYERDDWFATMHSVPPPAVMERNLARDAVTEGRNATTAVPASPAHAAVHARRPHHVGTVTSY